MTEENRDEPPAIVQASPEAPSEAGTPRAGDQFLSTLCGLGALVWFAGLAFGLWFAPRCAELLEARRTTPGGFTQLALLLCQPTAVLALGVAAFGASASALFLRCRYLAWGLLLLAMAWALLIAAALTFPLLMPAEVSR